MAEYIEREALLERWKRRLKYMVADEDGEYPINFKIVVDALEREPAADVVEVVRCKDCKHCDPETGHCDHPMGTALPVARKPDDFCSYGEKREVKQNG